MPVPPRQRHAIGEPVEELLWIETMPTKNPFALWALIGLEIVGGLIAIPWLPLGVFISCFIFDAPDSGSSLFAWLAWLLAVGWPWKKNVELLLHNGADINHMSEYGGPPIVDAFLENRYDVVLLLVSREANAAMANRWGQSIADLIRANGARRVKQEQLPDYTKVVETLRRRGLLSDDEARDAFTPKKPGL